MASNLAAMQSGSKPSRAYNVGRRRRVTRLGRVGNAPLQVLMLECEALGAWHDPPPTGMSGGAQARMPVPQRGVRGWPARCLRMSWRRTDVRRTGDKSVAATDQYVGAQRLGGRRW
jgi:hypothetical protein